MTNPDFDDDEVLLAYLTTAIDESDPVPGATTALAVAGFELRRLDEQLAELVADSLVTPDVLLRQESTSMRVLRFATPQLTVEVELGEEGSPAMGIVSPPAAMRIEVETVSGAAGSARTSLHSDELGRFQAPIRPGLWRLRCYPANDVVLTPWSTR